LCDRLAVGVVEGVHSAGDADLRSGPLERADVPGGRFVVGGNDHRERWRGVDGDQPGHGGGDFLGDGGGDGAPLDEPHLLILSRTVVTPASPAVLAAVCLSSSARSASRRAVSAMAPRLISTLITAASSAARADAAATATSESTLTLAPSMIRPAS